MTDPEGDQAGKAVEDAQDVYTEFGDRFFVHLDEMKVDPPAPGTRPGPWPATQT